MKRLPFAMIFTALSMAAAAGDVLVLNDGRKFSGRVAEKKETYEVTVEGQTLAFEKGEIARWIKSPKDIVGDADAFVEEAKQIYLKGIATRDEKEAEAFFRDALPKVQKARSAYVEARDLFPEGHPELDAALVNIMKLMRLVRERIGSQIASAATPYIPKPEPPPPAGTPEPEKPAALPFAEAMAILVDPSKRAEPERRAAARALFREQWEAQGPEADLAAAGYLFLSRNEKDWDAPANVLQAFFKTPASDSDKDLIAAAVSLAQKGKDLRPGGAEMLFLGAAASSAIARQNGKIPAELEPVFKALGFEKSEYGAAWGRRNGLALVDFRKWVASGEYGLAVVQFQNDYRSIQDLPVRYAQGLLMIFKALEDNRRYGLPASYLEGLANSAGGAARDHFQALARSIRQASPCAACGGTHKVNCNICRGKGRANFECSHCGGSGQVNNLKGVVACPGCRGAGRFDNMECPKCKAKGKVDCKARGCAREVPPPTFESFAAARACPLCQGKGTLFRHVAFSCPDCSGLGVILQPKTDPAKLFR